MPVPDTTSAEAFERYIGGKVLRRYRGRAWRDIKAWIIDPRPNVEIVPLPGVREASLAWTMSGEAEFQERETGGPWITHRLKKGSLFLTSGGAAYECRWKSIGSEPFLTMLVFLELPLLQRAMEEIFGAKASQVRLRDISAFTDPALNSQMEQVREELTRRQASPIFLHGLAETIAIHLVRNYAVADGARSGSPALPGFKLRQITDWMVEHLAHEYHLDQLASRAELSKFHFTRLFKTATSVTPSQYQLKLRINAAQQLLRETKKTIIEIGLEVGYNNPSRFAALFRRETGLTPSEYRRQI